MIRLFPSECKRLHFFPAGKNRPEKQEKKRKNPFISPGRICYNKLVILLIIICKEDQNPCNIPVKWKKWYA